MTAKSINLNLTVHFDYEPGENTILEGVEIEGFSDDHNERLIDELDYGVRLALVEIATNHMEKEKRRAIEDAAMEREIARTFHYLHQAD